MNYTSSAARTVRPGLKKPKPSYNTHLIAQDMLLLGWNDVALAYHSGLSPATVGRFLAGSFQTAQSAHKIARALGRKTVRRYLVSVEVTL